jgi:arylsulfatase A-like enzyme
VDAGRSKSVPGIRADRTLAEVLRSAGYATAGVFANVHLGTTRGLERGFDVYFQPPKSRPLFLLAEKMRARLVPWLLPEAAKPYPPATTIAEEVLRFVDAAATKPWFVMANFMEAHQPYAARAPHAGRFGGNRSWKPPVLARADDSVERKLLARDRYDEELASLDAQVARLLAELEGRDALARTWVVITSDHGEAFGERGTVNHGSSVYNEQVRIPLIVVPPEGVMLPDRAGAVGLLDVASTLAAVGADGDRLGTGNDLREPPRDGDEPARVEFFGNPSQAGTDVLNRWGLLWNTPARAVVWNDTKLVERGGRSELYDLGRDPGETDDLSQKLPASTGALEPLLPPLTESSAGARHTLTADEREALRALGYLGD